METGAAPTDGSSLRRKAARYSLTPCRFLSEDILFCVDIGRESKVEMKVTGTKPRPLTRIDAIRHALMLFVHSKLSINPDHRFAFSTLGESVSWLRKEFINDAETAKAAVNAVTVTDVPYGLADLTQLFRIAAHEGKKSRAQGRHLRVILIYCRSSVRPQHQWPINQKIFTLDVLYLHDKPGPDNCPQQVYDALVEFLEHVSEYEGYILESGQGLSRVLFRQMSVLLSHPQQRCVQDDLDIPKSLARKSPPSADGSTVEENVPTTSQ